MPTPKDFLPPLHLSKQTSPRRPAGLGEELTGRGARAQQQDPRARHCTAAAPVAHARDSRCRDPPAELARRQIRQHAAQREARAACGGARGRCQPRGRRRRRDTGGLCRPVRRPAARGPPQHPHGARGVAIVSSTRRACCASARRAGAS